MYDSREQARYEEFNEWQRVRQASFIDPLGVIAMSCVTLGVTEPGHSEPQSVEKVMESFEPTDHQKRLLGQIPMLQVVDRAASMEYAASRAY